ncbi:MAG: hypothetical protein QM594_13725 [Niabella sp.]
MKTGAWLINKLTFLVFLMVSPHLIYGQGWLDKLSKTIDKTAEVVNKGEKVARDADRAGREVGKVVKTVRSITWKKDNSPNIKYEQIPDYKSQEEVGLSRNQKLQVENGEFKNLQWQPVTNFENQVFPSFIIGWANYTGEKKEDMGSSLGFKISTSLSNVVLKWEIECTDKRFFNIDSGYINCDYLKAGSNFMPKISWDFRALTKHSANAPVNLYFRLTDPNSNKRVERLVTINLRSINDCFFSYNGKSYDYLFASYVNEEHPKIDNLLREMLNTNMINAVYGYQAETRSSVLVQVAALWRVLHDKGFQYSSITDNSANAGPNGLYSQTVRLIDNSLETRQANCVDGSVLIASVLKRIGIEVALITTPNHCFLRFRSDPQNNNYLFLETTALSDNRYLLKPAEHVAEYKKLLSEYDIPKVFKLDVKNQAYFLQFLSALEGGQNSYKQAIDKFGKEHVQAIDLKEVRQFIKPIPAYQ